MKTQLIPTTSRDLQILDQGRKGTLQLTDQIQFKGHTYRVQDFLGKKFRRWGTPEKRLRILVGKTDGQLNPLHHQGKGSFAVATSLKDWVMKNHAPRTEPRSLPASAPASGRVYYCLQGNGRRATISNAQTRNQLKQLATKKGWIVYVTHGDRSKADETRLLSQKKAPAKDSLHKSGKAADIVVYKKDAAGREIRVKNREVAQVVRDRGMTAFGNYPDGHLHVDTRRRMA